MSTTGRRELAEFIRQRRQQRGYRTQAELADRMTEIGPNVVPASYVAQWEAGRTRTPQQPVLRQLAQALGVSEVTLLRVSGVLSPEVDEELPSGNPFAMDDDRWGIVEALKEDDPFVVEACLAVVEHRARSKRGGR